MDGVGGLGINCHKMVIRWFGRLIGFKVQCFAFNASCSWFKILNVIFSSRSFVPSCHRAIVQSCSHALVHSCRRAVVQSCRRAIVPSYFFIPSSTIFTYTSSHPFQSPSSFKEGLCHNGINVPPTFFTSLISSIIVAMAFWGLSFM